MPSRMTVDPQATSKVRKTSSTAVFTKRHPTELPMTTWATATKKPGVQMPSFGVLPDEEIAAIAAWLGSLQ